jgi:ParB/RepB/Spo0J family partition protein
MNETQLIKIDPHLIDPSPYQSRKVFDVTKLQELTDSVREHGIIQPLVARYPATVPLDGIERLELVAGERRLRASIQAGLELVPVLVSVITDAAAEAMVLTENLQREGLTPAEEAQAFERLLKLRGEKGEALYTIAALAKMVSKDIEYVTARLKLLICPAELVTAVNEGRVSVSTAMLVGRIPSDKARAVCAKEVLTPEIQQVPLNFEQTKELIRERFMVKLDAKQFDLDDVNLVPVKLDANGERCQGGACTDCPFNSGVDMSRNSATSTNAAKGNNKALCTLPSCHSLKLDAAWREKKLTAERDGKKTLDGKAAEKAFSGYNGRLAYDADYVSLNEAGGYVGKTYVNEPLKKRLKGQKMTVVLARHPETHEIHELITKEEAAMLLKTTEAASRDTKQDLDTAEAEKQRKAEEVLQAKLDKLTLHEGMTEIVTQITGKGMDLEFLDLVFQLVLGMSGADGMMFMGKWLGITLPKGTANSGRDYEDDILKVLRERCGTNNAWLAHITLACIARGLKWSGVRCEDFELVLARCGLKVKELQRRAKALLAAEEKGKAKPEAKSGKAAKNSTDPTDFTAESEAIKTAAADKQGKGFVRKIEDYRCDGCGCELLVPFGKGDEVAKLAKGEMNCVACGGKWQKPIDAVDAGNDWDEWSIGDWLKAAKEVAAGRKKITDFIGSTPEKTSPEFIAWTAARVKLYKLAKKAK